MTALLTPETEAEIAHQHRDVEAHEHDPAILRFHGACYTCGVVPPCSTLLLLAELQAVRGELSIARSQRDGMDMLLAYQSEMRKGAEAERDALADESRAQSARIQRLVDGASVKSWGMAALQSEAGEAQRLREEIAEHRRRCLGETCI